MRRRAVAAASLLALVALCAAARGARPQDPARLDAQRVAGTEFQAAGLGPYRWLDGARYAALEAGAQGASEVVTYDAVSGARAVLVAPERLRQAAGQPPLRIEDFALSPDGGKVLLFSDSERVWRQRTRGEWHVLDLLSDAPPRRLGGALPKSSLMFCKFSPQGDRVAYVSGGDLYVEALDGSAPLRLTSRRSPNELHGCFDWAYEEEFDCRDGFRWSPDGSRLALWQLDQEGVGEFFMVDNLSDRYARLAAVRYPKAGTRNSACRIGVVPAAGGEIVWMQTPGDPRESYLPRMEWHPAGEELMVQWLPRAQNELQVLAMDAATGASRLVHRETDAAYIDVRDDFRWSESGASFLWTSDQSGWRRAYEVSWTDGAARALTTGDYDVLDVSHCRLDAGQLYFARAHRPTQRQLAALLPGGVEFVTQELRQADRQGEPWRAVQGGWHDYLVSPDGALAIHTRSAFDTPPQVDLVRLPSHERVRMLAANEELAARYAALDQGESSFFKVTTKDGVTMDGFLMLPHGFDPARQWPTLFHVYGEPWSQTVLDSWFCRHHLFHRWMTQLGYAVVSLDARGTPAPKGRDWRKALHRKIGVLSSLDWDQGVAALLARHDWMDRSRLGVWGWSGGGAMTLNLLFRYPERFAAGMSVAPVTDISLYDTIYQERYCGDPRQAPEVYRDCSPITFAAALQRPLLLVHGTGDDNVHWQHSERLVDALVAHGKLFEYLAYPNRTHAIAEGQGTRAHLYAALADFLQRRVAAGPR